MVMLVGNDSGQTTSLPCRQSDADGQREPIENTKEVSSSGSQLLLERHELFEQEQSSSRLFRPLSWRTYLYAPAAAWVLAFAMMQGDYESPSVISEAREPEMVVVDMADQEMEVEKVVFSRGEVEQIFLEVAEESSAYKRIMSNPLTKSVATRLQGMVVDSIHTVISSSDDDLSSVEYSNAIFQELGDRIVGSNVSDSASDTEAEVKARIRGVLQGYSGNEL